VGKAGWLILTFALLLTFLFPGETPAEQRRNAGLVAAIPTTITTEAKSRLTSILYGPLRRYEEERNRDPKGVGDFYLICDFNPDQRDNASDDPGSCQSLARYLRDLQKKQGIQVIAYVHGKVTRHAVLPVLACSEIILSQEPPAQLGKVTDGNQTLEKLDRLAYDEIPNRRLSPVLIRKMYDRNLAVIKSRDGLYHDANENPRPKGDMVPGLVVGETALYSFAQARDLGLCQPIPRNSIDEVLERY
jgi:hypothetical protein